MPFEFSEAFDVTTEGKESKLEVNADAFAAGNKLGQEVANALEEVQGRLDFMQKHLKKDLNTAELAVATLAIEEELEYVVIPDSFKGQYDAVIKKANQHPENPKYWTEASHLITGKILSNVNHFIGEKVKLDEATGDYVGTGNLQVKSRLGKIISIVDGESWTEGVSKEEAASIYKAVEKSGRREPEQEDIDEFQAKYVALRSGGKPDLLAAGGEAVKRAKYRRP